MEQDKVLTKLREYLEIEEYESESIEIDGLFDPHGNIVKYMNNEEFQKVFRDFVEITAS